MKNPLHRKKLTALLSAIVLLGLLISGLPTLVQGQAVTINLAAQNIAFDTNLITVPAGAEVTVSFTNRDAGIPHNFAVYQNSSAQQSIFVGNIITGPASATYTFTAPSQPGDYFFRCDPHAAQMNGTFRVTAAATPSPSPSPTATPQPTPTPSPVATPTPSPSPSPTPVVTPTPTPTPTPVATPTPTLTPTPTPTPTPLLPLAPPEVNQYARDWPLSNKDYANTRATTDSSINSSNVGNLGLAWSFPIPPGLGDFGSAAFAPIIMGDTVYGQDLGNNIYAFDLNTGQLKWEKLYDTQNVGPSGPAVGYGKVFASANTREMVALDASNGNELWRTKLADGVNGIDIQPQVYDGLVLVSTVPGGPGVFYAGGGRGVLYALDQSNGSIVWQFDTIDSPDLWGHPEINSGGGSWYPPAVDADGRTYWAIANPAPFPGQAAGEGIPQDWPNATSRLGPNLYTNTLAAIDHKTGNLDWFTQVWPHDVADYDLQISPILARANYNGRDRDVAITAGKMGRVYMMDRETGALLWDATVGIHNENSQANAYPTNATVTILPGILGGVETPMAYSEGVVYAAANNLGTDMVNGVEFRLRPFSENTGDLVALDVNTGRIIWDVRFSSGAYGGATVVNDLVFTGTYDGMLYAFNKHTAQLVWSYRAPAAVNAWPSFAGDYMIWPVAGAGTPSVMAFKLGSTSPVLNIMSPKNNENLPAGDITVTVATGNINIVDKQGQAVAAGEGHIHYYLDVDAPTTPGQPAVPPSGSIWATTADTSYTFSNVGPGTHTISVQLVNNDHTPLNPPVVQKITVTTDNNPRINITQPSNGRIRATGSIEVTVDVTNFNIVDKRGQAAVPGEGHVHFYMDIQPPTDPSRPAAPPSGAWAHVAGTLYTFENVSEGTHTFYVQLVNNDHTPLSPNVSDSVQSFVVTFTGGSVQP